MCSNTIKEDLRKKRTKKALFTAIFSLLKHLNFKKITTKEICEEASISRATFYSHFVDKYDLLKHWIMEVWPEEFDLNNAYEQLEKMINSNVHENMLILKNLIYDADDETFCILYDFILSTIHLYTDGSGNTHSKNIVLSNFYAGGIISYLKWQVNNNFPSEVPPMNEYFYDMIQELQDWHAK